MNIKKNETSVQFKNINRKNLNIYRNRLLYLIFEVGKYESAQQFADAVYETKQIYVVLLYTIDVIGITNKKNGGGSRAKSVTTYASVHLHVQLTKYPHKVYNSLVNKQTKSGNSV